MVKISPTSPPTMLKIAYETFAVPCAPAEHNDRAHTRMPHCHSKHMMHRLLMRPGPSRDHVQVRSPMHAAAWAMRRAFGTGCAVRHACVLALHKGRVRCTCCNVELQRPTMSPPNPRHLDMYDYDQSSVACNSSTRVAQSFLRHEGPFELPSWSLAPWHDLFNCG